MLDGLDALPTLATSRLRLRWPVASDAPALLEMFRDPEVMRYWGGKEVTDLAGAERYVADIHRRFADRSLFQWAITRQDEDRLIGSCTLLQFDLENRRAEIGYALQRSAWGRGYALEAVERVLDLAFEALALHRIEADVDPRNERSLTLLARLGFVREGLLRERWIVRGELQDSVLLGLLAREHHARRGLTARG